MREGGLLVTGEQKVILIALGVLLALCLIVGLTLNHHIGGFLETVAREEEEREREAEEDTRRSDSNE